MNPGLPVAITVHGSASRRRLATALHRRPRRILLFTSSLGFGHVRATQAIACALRRRMPRASVQTLDLWSLIDHRVAGAVRTAYLRLTQEHPDLYDRVYRLDQRTWRALLESSDPLPAEIAEIMALMPERFETGDDLSVTRTSPTDRVLLHLLTTVLSTAPHKSLARNRLLRLALIQSVWTRLSRRLASVLERFHPDMVVATQMNPAAMLSSARARGTLRVPTLGVLTDFGMHDFWIQPGIDIYCVAHASMSGMNQPALHDHRVVTTGIPLMPDFVHPPGQREARYNLGLETCRPTVVVAGGGLGLGVVDTATHLLSAPGHWQTVVSPGRNAAARDSLTALAARHPGRLKVLGWTDHMAGLLRAADVVVGKPGGLTVAEALACGRPVIATQGLRGQESFNVGFLEHHGVGRLVPEQALADHVRDLLDTPGTLARMQARAWLLGRRRSAAHIARLVECLVARNRLAGDTARAG